MYWDHQVNKSKTNSEATFLGSSHWWQNKDKSL